MSCFSLGRSLSTFSFINSIPSFLFPMSTLMVLIHAWFYPFQVFLPISFYNLSHLISSFTLPWNFPSICWTSASITVNRLLAYSICVASWSSISLVWSFSDWKRDLHSSRYSTNLALMFTSNLLSFSSWLCFRSLSFCFWSCFRSSFRSLSFCSWSCFWSLNFWFCPALGHQTFVATAVTREGYQLLPFLAPFRSSCRLYCMFRCPFSLLPLSLLLSG